MAKGMDTMPPDIERLIEEYEKALAGIKPNVRNSSHVVSARQTFDRAVGYALRAKKLLGKAERRISELEALAYRDELTGLFTRRVMSDRLEEALVHSEGIAMNLQHGEHDIDVTTPMYNSVVNETRVGLLMLDVDNFKKFNDQYGHLAGDNALRAVSRAIRNSVGRSDIPCRYGGEELAVILKGTDESGALVVANRIRKRLAETDIMDTSGNVFVSPCSERPERITVSQGLYLLDAERNPYTDYTSATVIREADAALYAAKEGGRNAIFTSRKGRPQRAALD